MPSATITIHWDGGAQTFDRDLLATAILLHLDIPDDTRAVVDLLVTEYGLSKVDAIYYISGAKVALRKGIEP